MSHYYSWIFRIFPWNAPLKTWRSSATAARWRAPVPPPWWRQRSPRGRAARCQRLSWLHVVQTHSLYEYLYVIYMDSLYYIDYRFFLGGVPINFQCFLFKSTAGLWLGGHVLAESIPSVVQQTLIAGSSLYCNLEQGKRKKWKRQGTNRMNRKYMEFRIELNI